MTELTQTDMDNLADIIWWIKGYIQAAENYCELCDFNNEHIESLRKVRLQWKEQQTEKL